MKKFTFLLLIYTSISIVNYSCESEQINGSKPDEIDPLIITDIEGNEYHTVRIGTQLWTLEDLRTTKYKDGTQIQQVTDDTGWKYNTIGAYCSYYNKMDIDTIRKYGLFYNWYAVHTGKLAPEGWHVPSIDEWYILRDYLIAKGFNWDSTFKINKIAKAIASQNDWKFCDTIGTIGNNRSTNNKSGFSALPSGSRYISGTFGNRGLMCHWWSTTPTFASNIFTIFLTYRGDSMVVHRVQKNKGFVVRIVKNK
jgi:uncharacterized protein (TIGR02145 family)